MSDLVIWWLLTPENRFKLLCRSSNFLRTSAQAFLPSPFGDQLLGKTLFRTLLAYDVKDSSPTTILFKMQLCITWRASLFHYSFTLRFYFRWRSSKSAWRTNSCTKTAGHYVLFSLTGSLWNAIWNTKDVLCEPIQRFECNCLLSVVW